MNETMNERSPVLSDDWVNGLTEHIKILVDKFSGQTAYARQINVKSEYINMICRDSARRAGFSALLDIADKSNYDRENVRKYKMEKRIHEPERMVEFENEKKREIIIPDKPIRRKRRKSIEPETKNKELDEMRIKRSPEKINEGKDIKLVNAYLVNRSKLNVIPDKKRYLLVNVLLNDLVSELKSLKEAELC